MNDLNFTQAATLLREINAQACGTSGLMATDTGSFIAVAQTTMKQGYDKVIGAISQVLSKTLFSVRPYTRKFAGLSKNEIQYGNHVRKITICDKDAENDPSVDGNETDHYKVSKPNVLQTNFYGESVFMRTLTTYKHQLDVAFSSPAEFMAFITACIQNVVDQMEKDHENMARAALLNFMGGLIEYDDTRVVHLLSEYNEAVGGEYTADNIRNPDNYPDFIKWAMARVRKISELMTERSYQYHLNLTGKNIPRHTPLDKQKLYIYGGEVCDMEARVLSSVYHDNYLKKLDYETVNFWQSIDDPTAVNVKPHITDYDGGVSISDGVTADYVFGILFDEDAIGYTVVNQWVASTPMNATGGYTNTAWHYTDRYWNDFTENGVLFLLD